MALVDDPYTAAAILAPVLTSDEPMLWLGHEAQPFAVLVLHPPEDPDELPLACALHTSLGRGLLVLV